MGKSTFYPSWEERKKQILVWATSEKTKVDRGTLKDSEYWKQFYRKSIELRPDSDDFLYFANEMIKVSRIYEEGKITKEPLNDNAIAPKCHSPKARKFRSAVATATLRYRCEKIGRRNFDASPAASPGTPRQKNN